MPRTKCTNVRSTSPFEKDQDEKREASEMESELSSSPKPEETSDRQEPDNEDETPVVRRYRMKLIPTHCGNPHRYKDYSPEPAGGSVSGEPVAGGSGLGMAPEPGLAARQDQSCAGKRGRTLESPDNSARSKRFARHDKVRKLKKMRAKRRLKRAAIPKEVTSSSSMDSSSIDSIKRGSSDGNHADSSSSEQEEPKQAKRVK